MRTLILGNGLIGKSIAQRLLKEGDKVTIASRSVDEKIDGVTYFRNSFEEIIQNEGLFKGVDNVIQTICTSSPAGSMQDIYKDAYENILLNIKLLEMLRKYPAGKFIFLSSGGAVYGNEGISNVDETHPTNPISAYGVAKISVEKYLHLYNYHFGLNYIVLRPSNVYGYIKTLKKPQGVISHILDCIVNNKQFRLWGSADNRKDYLFVDDLAEAVNAVLAYNGEYNSRVYNLANGSTYSLGEIIHIAENITGKKMDIIQQGGAKFDVSNIEVNGTLFMNEFDWSAKYDVESGIQKIVKQY